MVNELKLMFNYLSAKGIVTVKLIPTRLPFNRRRTNGKCMYLVTLVRRFCCCDLDLDPTTLMHELCWDNLKTCLSTRINFLCQVFQKHEQDRHADKQTDRHDRTHYSRISAWKQDASFRQAIIMAVWL